MEQLDVIVIGGGPAGLRAAEVAAEKGRNVTIFEGKPSLGRKFLVAGRGGLNLTHGEDGERFLERYEGGKFWKSLLDDFSNEALRSWCEALGFETFQASSGRVYPKALKGAAILRAWIARLRDRGVMFRTNHYWEGFSYENGIAFSNGKIVRARAVIFALGGASWSRTGSDGRWVIPFQEKGIRCAALEPSNCGWECEWSSEVLNLAEGLPLKNIEVYASEQKIAGELLITRYGIEGGAIYALGAQLRKMEHPEVEIDFKPTFSKEELLGKLGKHPSNKPDAAAKAWKLSKAALALLSARNYASSEDLATAAKSYRLQLERPRPMDEAISSAGGVCWEEIDSNLMLKKFPGFFVCGEMIDWDAPTGGYLMQGAFATGTRAGHAAAAYS